MMVELDKWEDDDNAIVTVAKEIGQQLQNMVDFTKSIGPIMVSVLVFMITKQLFATTPLI